tara:strand:+ start:324 stop:536 length:213 start_codon:yes stop_codon:yes gene_type:complete
MDSSTNNNSYLVSMNSYTTSKGKVKKSQVSNEQQYPNLLVGGEYKSYKKTKSYKKGGSCKHGCALGPNLL